MMKVLVTGSSGYIGRRLMDILRASGRFIPIPFDLKHNQNILDQDALYRPFQYDQIGAVVHLAGMTSASQSASDPESYRRTNATGTYRLLEAMRLGGCRKLVFASSCSVYGNSGKAPVPESRPHAPVSPYGVSKSAAERAIAEASSWMPFRYVVLRLFNVIGGDDPNRSRLVPSMMAASSASPLTVVMRSDAPFIPPSEDNGPIRDYVHVDDVARAFVCALDYEPPHVTVNIGTGRGRSVREMVEAASSLWGREIPCAPGVPRPCDPDACVADIGLAALALGWRPERTELKDILPPADRPF